MINKTAAIIAAAGAGNRLGADLPKALVKLVDKTLVEHAVANLAPIAQLIIVTSPAGYVDEYKKYLGNQLRLLRAVYYAVTVFELHSLTYQISMNMY